MDIVDLVGLHLVMSRTSGKAEVKFLVAGVGWATAELIMTRFIPLWVSRYIDKLWPSCLVIWSYGDGFYVSSKSLKTGSFKSN